MLLKFTRVVNILVKIVDMEWIRKRRKKLGLSQSDVATALQLSGFDVVRTTVSHWESGRVAVPLGNPAFVRELAAILRLDSTTLLEMAGYDISTQHSELSERVARLMDTMPEEKQQLALRLVEQLIENRASV